MRTVLKQYFEMVGAIRVKCEQCLCIISVPPT